MNLLYASLSYVPSRRASSMHVMRMCSALARAGHGVELLAKNSTESLAGELTDHAFYGVAPTFRVHKLARPAWRGGGVVFAAAMARELVWRRGQLDLVYSRELVGAIAALELGLPVVFESHGIPLEPLQRRLLRRLVHHRRLRGMVVISDALRRDMAAAGLLPAHRPVIVAHDAADVPVAFPKPRVPAARPRIGYVGNLYAGRGVELIVELARRMPACDFELVGGAEADQARIRAMGPPANLVLAGFVAPARLTEHYRSFDVLLMPHPRTNVTAATGIDISRWTSPMKMFEYMASGVPVIASDLPVLGEILAHERNALIATAGDVADWERAITRLSTDRDLAHALARTAFEDLVAHHTWDARVKHIFTELQAAG